MKRRNGGGLGTAVALAVALALAACGGGGNVYVGVGVAGPWVGPGYPGYYPPPVMGPRPPCCWYEDEDQDGDVQEDWLQEMVLEEWLESAGVRPEAQPSSQRPTP